jgi:hypothetical protein
MFEPFLSCKAFGLLGGPPDAHVMLARRWSGQPSLGLASDGSAQWESETAYEIEAERWYGPPPAVRFSTHNALIPMGQLGAASVIAFVSPISVIPVSFRNAAPRYLHRHHPGAQVVDLTLRLEEIAKDSRFVIRAIEGVASDGLHVVWRANRPSFFQGQKIPDLREFHAMEMDVLGQTAKLDAKYNISLSDVSEDFIDISKCLKWLFDLLHSFTTVTNPGASRTP